MYYGEMDPQYDTPYRRAEVRTRANTLLRRNFWLRQQHGRESSISHARHMKALCEPVSSGTDVLISMPYLPLTDV